MLSFDMLRDPIQRLPLTRSEDGTSLVSKDGKKYPIIGGIPRFVESQAYSSNFGLQWNIHNATQNDSHTGTSLTRDRLERCLREPLVNLRGKMVLEAGCGAGRFTELLVGVGAKVASFDLSSAVDANKKNLGARDNHLIAQANVEAIPFEPNSFDYVVALGMIQHTPNPERTIACLYEMVRPGGKLVIDHYRFTVKYYMRALPWMRLALKGVEDERAKKICDRMSKAFFPLHWAARNQPLAARVVRVVSPCSMPDSHALGLLEELGKEKALDWITLETFDALTDRYKHLRTTDEIRQTLAHLGAQNIEVSIGGNGVEAACYKPPTQGAESQSPLPA